MTDTFEFTRSDDENICRLLDENAALRAELRELRDGIPCSERLPELVEDDDNTSAIVLVDWFYICDDENNPHFGEEWREIEQAYLYDGKWWNLRTADEIPVGDDEAPTRWWPLPNVGKEGE